MRSDDRPELLDLDLDLLTTPEDVAALRKAAYLTRLDLSDYWRFLAAFPPPAVAVLREKRGPRSDAPFELVP